LTDDRILFPFDAVVGQDDAKLALLLNAVDPRIGGVLLRGHKGTAKSTLARGLAAFLDRPFVELPLGATEDRVIGSIDVGAALGGGEVRVLPGLLAAADGGVLYVDEVNLLADHLVDALLDVAASGVNRIEREGVSHTHDSRFVLIGSMNPEEGELRPQLLDRFGLAAEIVSTDDPADRAEAVRRRLAFDDAPAAFIEEWRAAQDDLRSRLRSTTSARVPDELRLVISRVCAAAGAEGLRADLTIARAAAALAGWSGRAEATFDDVKRVAPLCLAHRRRRSPFEDPGMSQDELDDAFNDVLDDVEAGETSLQDRHAAPDASGPVVRLEAPRTLSGNNPGRRSTAEASRGRLVGDRRPSGPVAVAATARAAAARTASSAAAPRLVEADLREAVHEQRVGNLLVLAVDASGSMGADARMEAAKGAVVSLLLDAYQRRDRVALVTFRDDDATVVLRPTSSVEVAKARVTDVPTGGRTPLAAGIDAARTLALQAGDARRPLVVLVSDGRATSAPNGIDPVVAAKTAADELRRARIDAVVVDAENGGSRLGLAREIADVMGARYLSVAELSGTTLAGAVRSALGADGS
jgi:magnesium chelatase subunit D